MKGCCWLMELSEVEVVEGRKESTGEVEVFEGSWAKRAWDHDH